jgi:hypothetical protein
MPFGELPLAAQAAFLSAETPKGVQIAAPLTNKGSETGWGSDNTFSYMGGPIRVTDRSGNVLFSGEGPEAAAQAVKFAQNLSDTMGPAAAWDIQQGERTINPDGTVGGTRWISGPTDVKDSDVGPLGLALDIGLPIAMNALLPGSGFLGQALGKVGATMAASGLGSALSGAVQGKSLSDIATSAGLSAATAGLLKGTPIGGYLDKAIGSIPVVGDVAKEIAKVGGTSAAANAVGDEIIVNALPSLASSVVPSLVAPTLASSIASKYPTYQPTTQSSLLDQPAAPSNAPAYNPLEDITATGMRLPSITTPFVPAASNLFSQAQYSGGENVRDTQQSPTNEQQEPVDDASNIIVTAQNSVNPSLLLSGVPGALSTNVFGSKVTPEGDIVATAEKAPKTSLTLSGVPSVLDLAKTTYPNYTPPTDVTTGPDITVTAKDSSFLLPSVASAIANQTLPALTQNPASQTPEASKKSDLDKIVEYLRLAGLGTSLIGGLLGSGSKPGTAGTIPAGLGGGLNPVFSAKLPAANLPGASTDFAVRPASEIGTANGATRDWNKYGFSPEASFFTYVPKRGYAHGGYSHGGPREPRTDFAVRGPGDGRSDDIPAVLSDGEYVMDAETVALLGNGSSKAGADALDRFRVNIRKHKGAQLAKGKFSVDAKQPERYLAGGRT